VEANQAQLTEPQGQQGRNCMRYDVFGMCNALFDIQAEVKDETLLDLGLTKGTMSLIGESEQKQIVPSIYTHIVNTGSDEHGTIYRDGLAAQGVQPNLGIADGTTGISLILVTPDAERTMCTFLGLSRDLTRDDVNVEDLRNSKYLYVTGYLWDTDNQKEAVLFAMQSANEAGVKVALSLSDPFCVHRHKDDFLRLLKDHVDVIFANAQEAQALTDTDSPYSAAKVLAQSADIVAITMDEKGSLLLQGDSEYEIPVYPVQAVDTTGAGDMYAAGLLYGLSQGLPLDVSGQIASYAAAQVVAKLGPRLETIDQTKIEQIKNRRT